MLRILFAVITIVVASSPWVYLLLFGGLAGANSEQEQEMEQLRQDLIVSRQEAQTHDAEIAGLEEDLVSTRSKLQFLEEGIAKAEAARDAAIKDRELLNEQLRELRGELADVENRLLEETNRANTLETLNEDIAARLDSSIQEVRRLQTIIRTLSNNS
ncbi:MAG: hypothetical protein ABQ298_01500 [Puniceicoccaceae bacterium]